MRIEDVTARLQAVRWGWAPGWRPEARTWLREYYRRLLPIWPLDRRFLTPADRAIESVVVEPLSTDARARIEATTSSLWDAATDRGEWVERTTRPLVRLVLAWALAPDASEHDPSAPLLELFEAGFQIDHDHHGIHLSYSAGWMINRVPTRTEIEHPDVAPVVEGTDAPAVPNGPDRSPIPRHDESRKLDLEPANAAVLDHPAPRGPGARTDEHGP